MPERWRLFVFGFWVLTSPIWLTYRILSWGARRYDWPPEPDDSGSSGCGCGCLSLLNAFGMAFWIMCCACCCCGGLFGESVSESDYSNPVVEQSVAEAPLVKAPEPSTPDPAAVSEMGRVIGDTLADQVAGCVQGAELTEWGVEDVKAGEDGMLNFSFAVVLAVGDDEITGTLTGLWDGTRLEWPCETLREALEERGEGTAERGGAP